MLMGKAPEPGVSLKKSHSHTNPAFEESGQYFDLLRVCMGYSLINHQCM